MGVTHYAASFIISNHVKITNVKQKARYKRRNVWYPSFLSGLDTLRLNIVIYHRRGIDHYVFHTRSEKPELAEMSPPRISKMRFNIGVLRLTDVSRPELIEAVTPRGLAGDDVLSVPAGGRV